MDISTLIASTHWMMLLLLLVISMLILTKSADTVVEESVNISRMWAIPSVVIGATVVSLGTTFPEVVVSVLAAIKGQPGLALGNAVGSIICDTGLVLGAACLIGQLPTTHSSTNLQGWLQLIFVSALVVFSLPFSNLSQVLSTGGNLSQNTGFLFLLLLLGYMIFQIKKGNAEPNATTQSHEPLPPIAQIVIKLILGFFFIGLSSECLIVSASEIAARLDIPDSIVAVTLVALGTSLPELSTAIISVRKGHGEIAIGNVVGADILNVLLVAGASAAVTPQGLEVEPLFFKQAFPIMLVMVLTLRFALSASKNFIPKKYGFILLGLYTLMSYLNIATALKT